MSRIDYDRYEIYRNEDGTIDQLPFVHIPVNSSDKYETWEETSRLDRIANRFYGNVFYDFLILYANPEYITAEDIPVGTVIRIPFPYEVAKADYEDGLKAIRNR